jgi:Ca2+-binding RTX toxin-like protein
MAKFEIMKAMGDLGALSMFIDFGTLDLTSSSKTKAVFGDLSGATITFKGTGFKIDGDAATGGTVTEVEFRDASGHLLLDVSDAAFALKKVWDTDYFDLLPQLQSGNDIMTGTNLGDSILAGPNGGNDKIRALDGDDVIVGSAGNNDIDGGSGRDVLNYEIAFLDGDRGIKLDAAKGEVRNAWGGTDTITRIEIFFGTFMNDVMKGSKADEVFNGMAGDDRMTGGGGDDKFHFFAGKDTITDFGDGNDLIHITYGMVDQFSDLTIDYKKGNAYVTFDDTTVLTVLDIAPNGLKAHDFLFGID